MSVSITSDYHLQLLVFAVLHQPHASVVTLAVAPRMQGNHYLFYHVGLTAAVAWSLLHNFERDVGISLAYIY